MEVLSKIINLCINLKSNFKYYVGIGLLLIVVAMYKFEIFENRLSPLNIPNNMVFIPGGEYLMGSDKPESYINEKPVHRVVVSSFFMDKLSLIHI